MSTQTLTFTQEIQAPPTQVYRAFTNAAALQEWFGDVVEAEPREGGRMYVWWNQGYFTAGQFSHLEENHALAFSWHGLGEPAPTNVRILLTPHGDGTLITLHHEQVPADEVAGYNQNWPPSLENLKSVLETGIDKRLYDRPMLGFFIGGLVDENLKNRLGLPISTGMHVAGVIDGMGAQKSGLKGEDVIFSVDGVEITSFDSIRSILGNHKGGDVVEAVVYRGPEKVILSVELSKRPIPAFPAPPADLAREGHAVYAEVLPKLNELLADVTEEEARHKASPGEWSIKEVLGHLLIGERWSQFSWSLIQEGNKFPNFPGQPLVSALAETYTLPELLTELRQSAHVQMAQIAALPESFVAQKGTYFLTANDFAQGVRNHFAQHTAQIQTALEAARKTS
ncbi:MAG: SRPBCC domain-containing protein [Anaerolineales bacterium]|nr:SRPBCC domain-containing protein [Anaerolineales bacterium]